MMVCKRRAPIFSVPSFTRKAKRATSSSASGVNSSFTPSVSSNAMYCRVSEVFHGERLQFHSNREAALQFGNQIARLRYVERASRHEQDVIGADHAVAR